MISSERISRRVQQLGREISEVYANIETPLVLVAILKGATVFAADLLRSLSIPAELEFVRAASYGAGTKSTGRVKIAHMVEGSLEGRHVLLVEDIVDSGRTADTILKRFRRMRPASVRVAALLDRPARREIPVPIDFTGFVIPDRFVIGSCSLMETPSMTEDDVRAAAARLVDFHERFAPLFGKGPAQDHAYTYVKGLMVCPERKSIEPIALHVGDGRVSALQKFLNNAPWDSGDIQPGKEFIATFTKPGTFEYYCKHHPDMKGTIIVK